MGRDAHWKFLITHLKETNLGVAQRLQLNIMAFCPENTLSETSSIPTPLMWEYPHPHPPNLGVAQWLQLNIMAFCPENTLSETTSIPTPFMWEYPHPQIYSPPPPAGEILGRPEESERAMKGTGKRSSLFDSFTTCNLFVAVYQE